MSRSDGFSKNTTTVKGEIQRPGSGCFCVIRIVVPWLPGRIYLKVTPNTIL